MCRFTPHRSVFSVSAACAIALAVQASTASASIQSADAARAKSGSPLASTLATLAQRDVRMATRAERARALSLPPSGPGSLVERGGDVVVNVRAETTSPGQVDALRTAGARVMHIEADLRSITVAVAPAELTGLAAVPGVENVSPELTPVTSAMETNDAADSCQGSVTSEADTQLRAAEAREEFGVSGAGVEVGVLSDSYDVRTTDAKNAADGVASGDLPGAGNPCGRTTPVDVVTEGPATGTDEGRGMLELVHDVAPDASLAFATASPSTAFPDHVAALREAGADVLVDDITYLDDPFYQPGPASVAIEQARADGAAYFSSAGNFHVTIDGQAKASWEAPAWRSTPCASAFTNGGYTACMNFAGASEAARNALPMRLQPGGSLTIDLQWAQPWFGVATDIDMFLVAGNSIVARSQLDNPGPTGTQKPFEVLGVSNTGATAADVTLIIAKWGQGPDPGRLKFVMTDADLASIGATAPEDTWGPTIIGHNGAPAAMSVAAVPASDSTVVEWFSSRGPVTNYFGPVNGTTPAARLGQPATFAKPDIAATDGARTTFFPPSATGVSRFYGTSAAAPHAAAVAALEMEAVPEATVDEIYDAQRDTARPVGSFGADAQGAGLVDAYAAVDSIMSGPPIAATGDAAAITTSSAILAGSVNPHGLGTVVQFEYSSAAGTETTPPQSIGAGRSDVQVSAAIAGLAPNTTYTYRVVATNDEGTTNGAERTITSASLPAAQAETGEASAISPTGATLAGTVNPEGTAASARFEYGTSIAYGSETEAQDIGSGTEVVDVAAALGGLQPGTMYHYRLVATNGAGTTHGADRTFTTESVQQPPAPTPDPGPSTPPASQPPSQPAGTSPPPPPAPQPQTIAVTLRGRTLQLNAPSQVTRAIVSVNKGKRRLARKQARLQSGAAKLRLRWSDVRNGRVVTVALAGSARIRIGLRPRQLRLGVGGEFAQATMQLLRGSATHASGSIQAPARALTLRLAQPRRPRSDSVVVMLEGVAT